jgi:hypothetical protein
VPDPEPAAAFPGPAVRADPALGLPVVAPIRTIAAAMGERDGRHFGTLLEQWTEAAQIHPTDSREARLKAWLTSHEAGFPEWTATYAPGTDWDFTPESLDALEEVVRRVTPSLEELLSAERRSFRDGAVWYFGEVLRRGLGGSWDSDRDGEFVRQVGPHRGKIIPVVTLKRALGAPGRLRERYTQFA